MRRCKVTLRNSLTLLAGVIAILPLVSALAFGSPRVNPVSQMKKEQPVYRQVQPVELLNGSAPPSRRDVWQRLKVPVQPDVPHSSSSSSSVRASSGAVMRLEYWDLNSLQRIEMRKLLRRGACPENIHASMRDLCQRLIDEQRQREDPADRPQQFHKGDASSD